MFAPRSALILCGLLRQAIVARSVRQSADAGEAQQGGQQSREAFVDLLTRETAPAWTALLLGLSTLFAACFLFQREPEAIERRKRVRRNKYEELMRMMEIDVLAKDGKAGGDVAEDLPEASRAFGLLWDDVSEVRTTYYGLDEQDPLVKFTEDLMRRLLKKELEEAISKTRDATAQRSNSNVGQDEASFRTGEKLRQKLEFAKDSVQKRLGKEFVDEAQLMEAERVLLAVQRAKTGDLKVLVRMLRPVLPALLVAIPSCMAAQALQSVYYQIARWQMVGDAALAQDDERILYCLLDLALGHLIIWFFEIIHDAFTTRASALFGQTVRTGVMKALMNQDFEYFDRNSSGALQERLNRDAEELSENFINLPQQMLGHVACIAFTLGQVALVCPTNVFLIAICPLPIICYLHFQMRKLNQASDSRGRKLAEEAASATAEVLKEIRTVRQFACEGQETHAFTQRELLRNKSRERSALQHTFCGKLVGVIIVSGLLFTEYIGAGLVRRGEMTPGLLFDITIKLNFWVVMRTVELLNILPRARKAFEPLGRVCDLLRSAPKIEDSGALSAIAAATLGELSAILERCETLVDEKTGRTRIVVRERLTLDSGECAPRGTVVAAWDTCGEERAMLGKEWLLEQPDLSFPMRLLISGKRIPLRFEGAIEFDSVVFRYPTDLRKEVLSGISFSVPPRKKVALVGEAGCGKSSCMGLLQRLYDPLEGCIRIDGIPLQEYNVKFLRSRVVIVDQKPVLFATSVRENVTYGLGHEVSDEQVISVLREASLWEGDNGIKSKPDQLLTKLGSGGVSLSGGQTQRVSIARAMIRKPDIILLDEATSALDNKNEKIVQEALDRLARQGSALVIAHRLTTVKDADKIVVVRKGKKAEEGSHEELLQMPIVREVSSEGQQDVVQGIYRFLWELQFHTDADKDETIESVLKDLDGGERCDLANANEPPALDDESEETSSDTPKLDPDMQKRRLQSRSAMYRRLRRMMTASSCIASHDAPPLLPLDRMASFPEYEGPPRLSLDRLATAPA